MYRSFGFYYLVSLFILSLFFLHIEPNSSSLSKQLVSQDQMSLEEKKDASKKYKRQLIEVLDAGDLPDLSRELFFGAKNQRGKNQSPEKSSNSVVSGSRSSRNSARQTGAPSSFLEELAHVKQTEEKFPRRSSSLSLQLQKELQNPKSHYFQGQSVRKLNIQMDPNGDFSVNVMSFPGAEYMIQVAKSIFRYWMDFLPAQMIQMGFIKTDGLGSLQAILVFSSQGINSDQYNVYFLKPFTSKTLNQGTLGAFSYYQMPMNNDVRIRSIGIEIKIYRDTLAVSANFEFQLWKA